MIFWKGKGLLVLVSAGLAAFFVFGFLGGILQMQPYANEHHTGNETMIIGATIMGIAAVFNTAMLHIPYLKDREDEVYYYNDGRPPTKISHKGTFMFLPRASWTGVFAIIGAILIFRVFFG